MKKLIFITLMLVSGHCFAQENLNAWIKECEKDKSVDMTVIDNKFPDTRKRDYYAVMMTLKDKPALITLFNKAYEKDRDKAFSKSEKRENGVYHPERALFYKTEDDKTVTETAFDCFYSKKKEAYIITMVITYDCENKELKAKRRLPPFGG